MPTPLKVLVSLLPVSAFFFVFGPLKQPMIAKGYDFLVIIMAILFTGFALSLFFRSTTTKDDGRFILTLLTIGYLLLLMAAGLMRACLVGLHSQLT